MAERDLNVLHRKYEIVSALAVEDQVAAELGVLRTKLFAVSSLADIQVDRLRLKLALQDNPDDVERRVSVLGSKVAWYEASFRDLLTKNPLKQHQEALRKAVDNMGWLNRRVFGRSGFNQKIAELKAIAEKVEQVQGVLNSSDDSPPGKATDQETWVIYYREQDGKGRLKAYYTDDLKLVPQSSVGV